MTVNVQNGDIAVIKFNAKVIDDGDGVVAVETGEMSLRAGDCGAIGGIDIAVIGMSVGDTKKLVVPPEQAFGLRDPSLVMVLPRSHFHTFPNLKAGSLIRLFSKSGKEVEVVTRKVDEETVTVDSNYPLAGMTLDFEMTVLAIKNQTK